MDNKQLNFLKNELRFRIWGLLSMNSELSFSELCKKLSKAKSTVHPHLQKLMNEGIVEVVREEKVRGNIKAKIYSLKKKNKVSRSIFTGVKDLDLFENINPTNVNSIISNAKSFEVHNRNFTNMKLRFYESLEDSDDASNVLNKIKEGEESFNYTTFLTEPQYREFINIFDDLVKKMNKIIEDCEQKGETVEKPYFINASAINMQRIIERATFSQKK